MRISDWSSDVCSSDLHAISGNGISRPGYSRHHIILRIDVNGCLFPKQPYSRPRRLRRSPRKVFCTALINPSQKSFIERLQKRTNSLYDFLELIVTWSPCWIIDGVNNTLFTKCSHTSRPGASATLER